MKARWWAEAAGFALLALLPFFFALVEPGHVVLYHHELPLRNLIFGLLLDWGALSVLCTLALVAVLRLPAAPRALAGALLAGCVLWRAVLVLAILPASAQANLDAHGNGTSPRLAHLVQTALTLNHVWAAGLVAVFLMLALLRPPIMRAVVGATRIGLAAFAFSALWMVPQLVYLATRPAAPRVEIRESPSAARHAPESRVVWLLFDELSYRLVFEQRPAGQEFPNLARLREQSFSLENIDPVGFYTERIVPSLMAGKDVDRIRSSATGELEYMAAGQHRWEKYDAGASLFALAHDEGWNPGVVGWYNPYCRLFGSMVSDCFWISGIHEMIPLEMLGASEEKSVAANALVLPEHYLARLSGSGEADIQDARERDIRDYRSIMARARALVANPLIRFAFVHLPVPHPPGIYNRHTHQLAPGGNYLDNLTLADDTLGELMREISASADADRTTVIVSSDHSWRVPMWRTDPNWTKEEEEISHGSFDPRPVFLVHVPGQTNGVAIRSVVPEMREHDILAAILTRQVQNETQMAEWLTADSRTVARQNLHPAAAGQ